MNTIDKNNAQNNSEQTPQKPFVAPKEGETLHTTNPFTGEKMDITPEDLEGIEKFNEAQTERD